MKIETYMFAFDDMVASMNTRWQASMDAWRCPWNEGLLTALIKLHLLRSDLILKNMCIILANSSDSWNIAVSLTWDAWNITLLQWYGDDPCVRFVTFCFQWWLGCERSLIKTVNRQKTNVFYTFDFHTMQCGHPNRFKPRLAEALKILKNAIPYESSDDGVVLSKDITDDLVYIVEQIQPKDCLRWHTKPPQFLWS